MTISRSAALGHFAGIVLTGSIVLPSLARHFGAESMSPGLVPVMMVQFILLLAVPGALRGSGERSRAIVVFFALLLVLLHGALAFLQLPGEFKGERFAGSYVLLVAYVSGALAMAKLASRLRERQLAIAVGLAFWILILSGVAAVAGFRPFHPTRSIAVMFFSEHSHYAIDLVPLALFFVVRSERRRKFLILGGCLALALALKSMTLLIGTAFVASFALRSARIAIFLALAAAAVAFPLLQSDNEYLGYFTARADLSADSSNLSALAFMQGWEKAFANFLYTYGLGVGFQQHGLVGPVGRIAQILDSLNARDLNLLDGATIAAKLVSEFGVLGILVVLAYLRLFVRSAKVLRQVSQGKAMDARLVFAHSVFAAFAIDLFVRGTGYFSSSGFLFLAAGFFLFGARAFKLRSFGMNGAPVVSGGKSVAGGCR